MPNQRPSSSAKVQKSRPKPHPNINAVDQGAEQSPKTLRIRLSKVIHGYIDTYPQSKHQGQPISKQHGASLELQSYDSNQFPLRIRIFRIDRPVVRFVLEDGRQETKIKPFQAVMGMEIQQRAFRNPARADQFWVVRMHDSVRDGSVLLNKMWRTLCGSLTRLNANELRYVNLQRNVPLVSMIDPQPLPSGIVRRSRPSQISRLTGDHERLRRQQPDSSKAVSMQQTALIINVRGEQDWVFTGFCSNPRLLSLIESYEAPRGRRARR